MASEREPRADGEPSVADLQARVAELEAVNDALSTRLDESGEPEHAGPRWRTALAVVLIVLATILTPPAIIAGWARVALTDTDAFVATYAPLATNPDVQAYVTDEVVGAIDAHLDIDSMVSGVVDGLTSLMPDYPKAQKALKMLEQPAAEGVRSTLRSTTASVVDSDAFADAWAASLRESHARVIALLQGDPDTTVSLESDGIGLRLGPVVAAVKERLQDQGFALAAQIPSVDKTITIVQVDSLPQIQLAYRTAVAVGFWLAPFVLVLFGAAVALSNRRARMTIGACVGLALGAGMVLGAVAIGSVIAHASVPPSVMPPAVLDAFYETVGGTVQDIASGTLLLALVVAVVTWLIGPFRSSRRLRTAWDGATSDLKGNAEARGISTGGVGTWLFRYRVGLRIAVGLIALAVLLLNRPIHPGLVFEVALWSLIGLLVLNLLERRPTAA